MPGNNIPKKVYRHVLKALETSYDEGPLSGPSIEEIVRYSMRNLVPVKNLTGCIKTSLDCLRAEGMIQTNRDGRFFLINSSESSSSDLTPNLALPPKQQRAGKQLRPEKINAPEMEPSPSFEVVRTIRNYVQARPKKKHGHPLDPNLRRTCCSEDSLSGDEFERTRKRLRTNTKRIKQQKVPTKLPHARKHSVQSESDSPDTATVGEINDDVNKDHEQDSETEEDTINDLNKSVRTPVSRSRASSTEPTPQKTISFERRSRSCSPKVCESAQSVQGERHVTPQIHETCGFPNTNLNLDTVSERTLVIPNTDELKPPGTTNSHRTVQNLKNRKRKLKKEREDCFPEKLIKIVKEEPDSTE